MYGCLCSGIMQGVSWMNIWKSPEISQKKDKEHECRKGVGFT